MECVVILTIWEDKFHLEDSSLPQSIFLSGNGTLPALEVQSALRSLLGLCDKAEGVVATPLLTVRSKVVSTFLMRDSPLDSIALEVSHTAPLGGD